ncbi:hypothetical protein ACFQ1E_17420 [Sphingomonas canadensis]|uniref:Uncharacterized protein n=1 Tax=Sphingomonas canadensis TaxID=1219257 RepID=A0ABW3HF28_9SPHN|nr:hypothetical protein [Sphingomonas canadensis]MCW3837828.1 hypothetical protein [Sphingomonas canadensis]
MSRARHGGGAGGIVAEIDRVLAAPRPRPELTGDAVLVSPAWLARVRAALAQGARA